MDEKCEFENNSSNVKRLKKRRSSSWVFETMYASCAGVPKYYERLIDGE